MGDLLISAVLAGDLIVAQTVLLILATAVVFFNLMADMAYAFLDPRIQYG
jgi:peptide/nickel transport system permease protein